MGGKMKRREAESRAGDAKSIQHSTREFYRVKKSQEKKSEHVRPTLAWTKARCQRIYNAIAENDKTRTPKGRSAKEITSEYH